MSVTTPHPGEMPAAKEHPTIISEDGSRAEVGFVEADPVGPSEAHQETLLAGKFKTPEDLEKAYKELESRLGTPQENEPPESTKPHVAAVEVTEEATATLRDKGLDISDYTREYESTGQLSEESFGKLEKAGISRAMVDQYISGQRVLVDSQVAEVRQSVGGEAEYQRLISWAATSFTPQEQQAYNTVLATNDMNIIKLAAQGLKAQYETVMGKDPQVVVGGQASAAGGNTAGGRFESRAQMVEAMKDPRYANDPAYRTMVERKVLNSTL